MGSEMCIRDRGWSIEFSFHTWNSDGCFLLFFPSFSFFPFLSFFLSSFCVMNEVIFVSFLSPSLAGLRRCHCNHCFVSLTTAPLPTLLNFDLDARRFQALQEENESLRNQVQVNLIAALLLLSVAGFCKGIYIHYKCCSCVSQSRKNVSHLSQIQQPIEQ